MFVYDYRGVYKEQFAILDKLAGAVAFDFQSRLRVVKTQYPECRKLVDQFFVNYMPSLLFYRYKEEPVHYNYEFAFWTFDLIMKLVTRQMNTIK